MKYLKAKGSTKYVKSLETLFPCW